MRKPLLATAILTMLLWSASAARAGTVIISLSPSTSTITVGQTLDVVVQVQAGAQQVDVAAAYLNFDSTLLTVVSVTPGTALPNVAQNTFSPPGTVNFAAFTFSSYPTGTFTLATVRFQATNVSGTTALSFVGVNPRKTDATFAGGSVLDHANNGSVTVGAAATATRTPTATITPTAGGPTNTPSSGTPTRAPTPRCVGDCGNKGYVSPSDVQTCTLILGESLPLSVCPQCDADGDGQVFVGELTLAGLNKANGCPGAPEVPVPWVLNPGEGGTQPPALALGHLRCKGPTDRGCLQIPVFDDHPSTVIEGDIWIVNNTVAHELCYLAGAVRFCADFVPQ